MAQSDVSKNKRKKKNRQSELYLMLKINTEGRQRFDGWMMILTSEQSENKYFWLNEIEREAIEDGRWKSKENQRFFYSNQIKKIQLKFVKTISCKVG